MLAFCLYIWCVVFISSDKFNCIVFSRLVQTMDYSVIVFDTAPTGHTLRLLQFPSTLEKGLEKVMTLRNKFGGVISQVNPSPLPVETSFSTFSTFSF